MLHRIGNDHRFDSVANGKKRPTSDPGDGLAGDPSRYIHFLAGGFASGDDRTSLKDLVLEVSFALLRQRSRQALPFQLLGLGIVRIELQHASGRGDGLVPVLQQQGVVRGYEEIPNLLLSRGVLGGLAGRALFGLNGRVTGDGKQRDRSEPPRGRRDDVQ